MVLFSFKLCVKCAGEMARLLTARLTTKHIKYALNDEQRTTRSKRLTQTQLTGWSLSLISQIQPGRGTFYDSSSRLGLGQLQHRTPQLRQLAQRPGPGDSWLEMHRAMRLKPEVCVATGGIWGTGKDFTRILNAPSTAGSTRSQPDIHVPQRLCVTPPSNTRPSAVLDE